jgi:hypothetical protein
MAEVFRYELQILRIYFITFAIGFILFKIVWRPQSQLQSSERALLLFIIDATKIRLKVSK